MPCKSHPNLNVVIRRTRRPGLRVYNIQHRVRPDPRRRTPAKALQAHSTEPIPIFTGTIPSSLPSAISTVHRRERPASVGKQETPSVPRLQTLKLESFSPPRTSTSPGTSASDQRNIMRWPPLRDETRSRAMYQRAIITVRRRVVRCGTIRVPPLPSSCSFLSFPFFRFACASLLLASRTRLL